MQINHSYLRDVVASHQLANSKENIGVIEHNSVDL